MPGAGARHVGMGGAHNRDIVSRFDPCTDGCQIDPYTDGCTRAQKSPGLSTGAKLVIS